MRQWSVMDGMHRVAKACISNQSHILAVQFEQTPKPDFINIDADLLNYRQE